MLDLEDIAAYLMDRKLVGPWAVVEGRLRVFDVSRLNRVFLVEADGERSLVVKLGSESGVATAREAAVLERLGAGDGRGMPPRYLPAMVAYDGLEGVLILEASPGAHDLRRHHARGRFSLTLAREAGRALAFLHALPPAALDGLPTASDPTWTLGLHQPDLAALHTLSGAGVELVRTVQGAEDLCAGLDDLRALWRQESVVHGDIRWDNCVAVRSSGSNRFTRLQLIDWEHAAAGDPAFDIGAFFGEYLRAWLESIPITDPSDPRRLLAHARFPLRRMQPALRAFWDAYARHRQQAAAELSRTLRRATRFAAVRLLTAALEQAQTLGELRASVLYLVQLSHNILRRPDEAAAHLLGLRAYRTQA